ncbi:MAG: radical SAM protein [Methylococcus sp.]|nr:MAG: radical SAM protein [Methylococcus sp.]
MSRPVTNTHSRDNLGMTYVYSVLSRRSGGLSIGINLNPNNACNWRCVYCQVPNLIRGAPPPLDPGLLEDELRRLLQDVQEGDFYERHELPGELRVIRDIAIAGNGEPTSCPEFAAAVAIIGQVVADFDLLGRINLVLISNGSLMHKPEVQAGLAHWSELGGQVWFKIDSATEDGMSRINNVSLSVDHVRRNLASCAALCPTWIQTCVFGMDGQPPGADEQQAYLDFLAGLEVQGIAIEGVLLYRLDRPSNQPEATRLHALPAAWLHDFSQRIEALGIHAKVHV